MTEKKNKVEKSKCVVNLLMVQIIWWNTNDSLLLLCRYYALMSSVKPTLWPPPSGLSRAIANAPVTWTPSVIGNFRLVLNCKLLSTFARTTVSSFIWYRPPILPIQSAAIWLNDPYVRPLIALRAEVVEIQPAVIAAWKVSVAAIYPNSIELIYSLIHLSNIIHWILLFDNCFELFIY